MVERRPTVYDVAERAKVSIATVSFAYTRPDQISAATRERVLEIAREIGYIPSASARGLARGRTGALGLHSFDLLIDRPQVDIPIEVEAVIDTSYPPGISELPWNQAEDEQVADPRAFPLYVDEVQRGFELECRAHHRPVMLTSGSDTTMSVAETAGRVDGLAIFPAPTAFESLAQVSLKMPIVLFSTPPGDDVYHRVLADNSDGMRQLVTHLVTDHRIVDLAFIGAPRVADYRERFEAFSSTMSQLGLVPPLTVFDDTLLGEGPAFTATLEAIRSGALPRVLVCASDQIALALLDLLHLEGISVPQDVIVTGFDGILAGRLSTPPLTTVRQPMEAMGRAAARILMKASPTAPSKPTIVRLGTSLVTRESCGCSPAENRSSKRTQMPVV